MIVKKVLITLAFGILTNAFAGSGADVAPVSIKYKDIPATTGGEFPQPAHQRVILSFKNVGGQYIGKTKAQLCPNYEDDQFCLYRVLNKIGNQFVTYEDSAVKLPKYLPGQTYHWELTLKPKTLADCKPVSVWMDVHDTLGQFGFGDVFANDKAKLVARRIGSTMVCPTYHSVDFDDERDFDSEASEE